MAASTVVLSVDRRESSSVGKMVVQWVALKGRLLAAMRAHGSVAMSVDKSVESTAAQWAARTGS